MNKNETEAYLAKIKKTVADSKALVETVRLRMAETDRLLEKQGLTREKLRAMKFTDEQKALVNEELRRRGLPALEDVDETAAAEATEPAPETLDARRSKLAALAAFRHV